MDFVRLNPVVRDAGIFECAGKKDLHVSLDARLFFLISGELAVTTEKKKIRLSPGNALYLPAGTRYKVKSAFMRAAVFSFDLTSERPEPKTALSAVTPDAFCPEDCHTTADAAPFDKEIFIEDLREMQSVIEKICALFVAKEGYYLASASAGLKEVLLFLAECVDEHALPSRMTRALHEYIHDHVGEDLSNTEIGAIFGYHPFYISKMLKDRRGETLKQYIIGYRMKVAKRMLELTDKTVGEIAEELGFSDASYFTKSFKASFGMTPKEYRNERGENYL